MAQHFGVNRHTVRRALAYLSRDGFVLIAKGRGVFVADAPKLGFIIDGRTSFWQNVRAARLEPSTVLLKVGDEEAGLRLGGLLDIHPQRMVLHLRCLLLANGVPLALESSWLSKDRFPRFGDAFRRAGTISEALASYGVEEPWRDSSRIITRVADDAECALLRAGEPAALLVSEAVHRDGRGAPVALTSTAFCAQRVSLHITHGGAPA